MRTSALAVTACLVGSFAFAQSSGIEGYWQDTERRILFSPDAPPGYVFGRWTKLDQQQTYPSAKQIRRSGKSFELVDLMYDDEESIKVVLASEQAIEFTRTNRLSGCSARHQCGLEKGDQLLCTLETVCSDRVVWRGEERYARRTSCERDGKRQAQGIPVRCR